MRPFLKSTRFILSLSIFAHAVGVIALLYSIGILSLNKKDETTLPAQTAQTTETPQAAEVGTATVTPALPPTPAPQEEAQVEVEAPKVVHKAVRANKPKVKVESRADAQAERDAEAQVASEDKANDVKIVAPAPMERVENKALLKSEEAPAKLEPVKERPDGVQAQDAGDGETEAKSKDAQEPADPMTESGVSDATEGGGKTPAAI